MHGKNRAMPIGYLIFCLETVRTLRASRYFSPLYSPGKLKDISRVSFFSNDLEIQNRSSSYSLSEVLLEITKEIIIRLCHAVL